MRTLVLAALAWGTALALEEGLTMAWATPIVKKTVALEDDASLARVAGELAAAFDSFCAADAIGSSDNSDGASANDRFFEHQRAIFQKGGDPLEDWLSASGRAALHQWRAQWLAAARSYVEMAAGADGAAELFSSEPRLFAWVGVHSACSHHQAHVHEGAAVSAAFYLAVPAGGGGDWFSHDPRGMRPPFSKNRMQHLPAAGELLLFPSWLSHGVAPRGCVAPPSTPGEATRRVAISFNLWPSAAAAGSAHWELLADATIGFPNIEPLHKVEVPAV